MRAFSLIFSVAFIGNSLTHPIYGVPPQNPETTVAPVETVPTSSAPYVQPSTTAAQDAPVDAYAPVVSTEPSATTSGYVLNADAAQAYWATATFPTTTTVASPGEQSTTVVTDPVNPYVPPVETTTTEQPTTTAADPYVPPVETTTTTEEPTTTADPYVPPVETTTTTEEPTTTAADPYVPPVETTTTTEEPTTTAADPYVPPVETTTTTEQPTTVDPYVPPVETTTTTEQPTTTADPYVPPVETTTTTEQPTTTADPYVPPVETTTTTEQPTTTADPYVPPVETTTTEEPTTTVAQDIPVNPYAPVVNNQEQQPATTTSGYAHNEAAAQAYWATATFTSTTPSTVANDVYSSSVETPTTTIQAPASNAPIVNHPAYGYGGY